METAVKKFFPHFSVLFLALFCWMIVSSPNCFAVKRSLCYDFDHLSDYLTAGDVFTANQSAEWLNGARDPIVYTSSNRLISQSSLPILPFQMFGVLYEQDFIVETNNPDWSMHEFAKVVIGDTPIWIAKDSDANGIQTVNANLANLDEWVPEVPIPRHPTNLTMDTSASTPDKMVVHLQYLNAKGQNVIVDFSSKLPPAELKKRNGSTFNHSAQAVSALLDIQQEQESDTSVTVSYDGKVYNARKVLGLVPAQALLEQTQGGFAIASMKISAQDGGFNLRRPALDSIPWNTHSNENWTLKGEDAIYTDKVSLTNWDYQFNQGELTGVTVSIPARSVPITNLQLSAPLPDLARPFAGIVQRNFVMRINDQIHGYGTIEAEWIGVGATVRIRPIAPSWFAARPMETTVIFDSTGAIVTTVRVDP